MALGVSVQSPDLTPILMTMYLDWEDQQALRGVMLRFSHTFGHKKYLTELMQTYAI